MPSAGYPMKPEVKSAKRMIRKVMLNKIVIIIVFTIIMACFHNAVAFSSDDSQNVFPTLVKQAETDDRIRIIPGPYPGMKGITARQGQEAFTIRKDLDSRVGSRGSLSMWIKLDRSYQTGEKQETIDLPLIFSENIFRKRIFIQKHMIRLDWNWWNVDDAYDFRTIIPGISGPAWHHFAYQWDAERGYFQGFLNGTRLRLDDVFHDAWEMPELKDLTFHMDDRVAFADVRVSDHLLSEKELKMRIPEYYRGALDRVLGVRELGKSGIEQRKGSLLYQNPLSRPEHLEDWVMEGPGNIEFHEGWIRMYSPGMEGHHVLWNRTDFPENFIAEWEIQIESEHGLCIVFFAAKGRHGGSIFDPALQKRDGIFHQYHSGDINTYHASYFANNSGPQEGRITSNLRKNHGFFLVSNGPVGIQPGSEEVHKVTLMKDGNHIEIAVDGQRIISFYDDGKTYGEVLGNGKIGLRQMEQTTARYRNFKVYEVR
jgi:hypothetical protein